jgi:hypothetical protein
MWSLTRLEDGACAHIPILQFGFSSVKVVRHKMQTLGCGKATNVPKEWAPFRSATLRLLSAGC